MEEFLTPKTCAQMAGVSESTILRALRSGELASVRPHGRWHVSPSALADWLAGKSAVILGAMDDLERAHGTGSLSIDGQGRITAQRTVSGKRMRKRVATVAEGHIWLDALSRAAGSGGQLPTLRTAFEHYLAEKEITLSYATHLDYTQIAEKVIGLLDDPELHTLTPKGMTSFRQALEDTGLSPASKRRIWNVAKACLNHACVIELIDSNPLQPLKGPSMTVNDVRERSIPAGDLARLKEGIEALECNNSIHHNCPVRWRVGLLGLRQGEVLALSAGDFTGPPGARLVTVSKRAQRVATTRTEVVGGTKTGTRGQRSIPVEDSLYDMMRHHVETMGLADDDLLWRSSAGGPRSASKDLCDWRRLLDAAGIAGRGYTIHGLRHTVATMLANQHEISLASQVLGHSSLEMTNRYVHHHKNEAARDALRF